MILQFTIFFLTVIFVIVTVSGFDISHVLCIENGIENPDGNPASKEADDANHNYESDLTASVEVFTHAELNSEEKNIIINQ